MRRAPRWPAAAALALLAAGCASEPTIYHWGAYEECVWTACSGAEREVIAQEIRALTEDVEKARAAGLKDPPGLHAHLGYLYLITGNPESAAQQFRIEKELWVESAVFMDRLLARIGPGP